MLILTLNATTQATVRLPDGRLVHVRLMSIGTGKAGVAFVADQDIKIDTCPTPTKWKPPDLGRIAGGPDRNTRSRRQ